MAAEIAPRPRVLHLFSDWKWTGPSEAIVTLCRALRRHGFAVDLACRRAPGEYPQSIEHRARERRVEPVLDFHLEKNTLNLFKHFEDIRSLTEYIDREEVQILHVHSSHDHYLGSRAARRSNNRPAVVRTNHAGVPLSNTWINRRLIRKRTDGWVAYTESCREADTRAFGINPHHSVVIDGAVDFDRFQPTAPDPKTRTALGLERGQVVAGVVARMQPHRRFEVLIPALAAAIEQEPSLRALVIGRGTRAEELVHRPVRELGMAGRIILPGYRSGDYADVLASIDFLIFLVPGSDGSCRAVREAMAMGKPILAARRGLLPELVEDGRCGFVIDDTQENLTQAILRLAHDAALRDRLGQAALAKARERFQIDRQVEAISQLYLRLAEGM